ncbi:VanW family protein [Gordonia sp. CPCC 206044]|uniref:VanW family protein n=1 Tax=Gordonia sp. CPCC 206044 TaxID=3140793 RepID=UPI003AF3A0A3
MSIHPSARVVLRVVIGVCAAVGIALAVDLLLTFDKSGRGTVIAGIDAGNLDAEQVDAVTDRLADRATERVRLRTPSGAATTLPAELGLNLDVEATRARLLEQPRNPLTRIAALFGASRPVEPVVTVERDALDRALDTQRPVLEQAAVEGGVHYVNGTPTADMPAAGKRVARDDATSTLAREWLDGDAIDLPTEDFSPTVSAEVVEETVAGPAARATSAPLTVTGERTTVRIEPARLGEMLRFGPDGNGGLRPVIDQDSARSLLAPRLARTEHRAVDATFSLSTGTPVVVPSRDGTRIDWPATLASMSSAAVDDDPAADRVAEVAYRPVRPRLDTAAAHKLGVREVVSEFTTSDFTSASGENIRLAAAEVDGALVRPGATFSLNTHTGPRGAAQGYVDSTIIDHGRAAKAVGGGISQFATTLYNAAYFAGLEDVDHTEHSYYISRYPEAREATVFEGAIDLAFRNNTRHGIYIETSWDPSSVTVRMWSTKTVEVQSLTGERSAYTDPPSKTLPKGDDCIASSGSRGFTTSNTRVITDARSGAEVSRHTRTVKYDPEPKVTCR